MANMVSRHGSGQLKARPEGDSNWGFAPDPRFRLRSVIPSLPRKRGLSAALLDGLDRFAVQREIEELFRLNDEDASELILVRHAEPALRSAKGTAGEDPLLSCTGLVQAERLAERLRPLWVETIYTAPERRSRQTAVVLAESTRRPVQTLDALADIEFAYEQALLADRERSYGERFQENPRWDAMPGFAPGWAFRRRAIEAVECVIAAHEGGRAIIVTHASVINAFFSMLLEVPRDMFFAPEHASVNVVRCLGDLQAVRSVNDTAHLEGLISGW